MKGLIVLTIFLVATYAEAGSNERYPKVKRQVYRSGDPQPSPPPNNYGQPGGPIQPGVLPPGVVRPLIPPTYGNDKGAGHQYQDYEDSNTLPGIPGQDYPIHGPHPPQTSFSCASVPHVPGYYANVDYGCQVFHVCEDGGKLNTFVCPNGTIYNQRYFVCDWWYNVNCGDAISFYGVNGELYQVPPGGYQHSGGGGTYGPQVPSVGGGGGGTYGPQVPSVGGGGGGTYGQPVPHVGGGHALPAVDGGSGVGYSGPGVGVQRYTPSHPPPPPPPPVYAGGPPAAQSGYGVVRGGGHAPSYGSGGPQQVSGGGYGSRTSVIDTHRSLGPATPRTQYTSPAILEEPIPSY